MTAGGFQVTPADLVTHGATIDRISELVVKAGEKGAGVQLGSEAYGVICGMFADGVRAEVASTATAVTDVGTHLQPFGGRLRDASAEYVLADQQIAELLDLTLEDTP